MSNQPTPRTAEFAELVAFFSKLAARPDCEETSLVEEQSDRDTQPIYSDEFAPILRNLISHFHARKKAGRLDGADHESVDGEAQKPEEKFGTNEFPFTFNMALHKLYKTEEWAEKVKEVLQKSREEWRPLKDKDDEEEQSSQETGSGHSGSYSPAGRSKLTKNDLPRPRKPTVIEQRLQARARLSGQTSPRMGKFSAPRAPTSPRAAMTLPRSPLSPKGFNSFVAPASDQVAPAKVDNVRITKKRCVGRRKSEIELFCTGTGANKENQKGNSKVVHHKMSELETVNDRRKNLLSWTVSIQSCDR